MSHRAEATTVAAALAAAVAAPALTTVAPVRRRVLPGLSGITGADHVALTYDDGPDPVSTPHFLRLLERHGVRATFFLLGRYVARHPALVRDLAAEGHELAVHGWDHGCVLTRSAGRLATELAGTRDRLADLSGRPARWYRPPYGVLSTPALLAARRTGLTPVLWSAWGRDWEARATPDRILATVLATLRPGGTVLLHDTDRTSAPGSWHTTLAASDRLLRIARERSWPVGPLTDHSLRQRRRS